MAEKKRRPPPIAVEPFNNLPIERPVPGPNAFALATTQKSRSAEATPMASTFELDATPLRKSGSQKSKSRTSLVSDLFEAAKGRLSPRKSDGPPPPPPPVLVSRGTSIGRHSRRSSHSTASSNTRVESVLDKHQTARGEIEAQNEKKLFKLMGQVATTPTDDGDMSVQIVTNDLRGRQQAVGNTDQKRDSSRKKIFGMSIPGFRSSGSNGNQKPLIPQPQMPPKAAQVFGTSLKRNPKKFSPKPIGNNAGRALSSKVYEQHAHTRDRRLELRNRPARLPMREVRSGTGEPRSQDLEVPPTPPRKDTPPKNNMANADKAVLRARACTVEKRGGSGNLLDPAAIPQFPSIRSPVSKQGGESPRKFEPFGAQEYLELIEGDGPGEGDRIVSSHVEVESTSNEEHEPETAKKLSSESLGVYGELPPRFYSPSNYSLRLFENGGPSQNDDKERFLFSVPNGDIYLYEGSDTGSNDANDADAGKESIGMIFQGSLSDIDPASKTAQVIAANMGEPFNQDPAGMPPTNPMHNLQIGDQPHGSLNHAGYLQPETSRLTEILSHFSPSKVGYSGDFDPNCLSAVPSPLHKHQAPAVMVGPPFAYPPPHYPVDMGSHFQITNEHIDLSANAICALQEKCLRDYSARGKQLDAFLDEQFKDVKAQIRNVSQLAGNVSEQNHNVNSKLDKLHELLKKEIITHLVSHGKKMESMEQSVKDLKKVVQGLQKAAEDKSSSGSLQDGPPMATAYQYPGTALPGHRSQPSLVGYYGAVNDGRPPMPDARNDARLRYGNANTNNANYAMNWGRGPYGNRDGKEDVSPTNSDPYANANANANASGDNPGQFNNYMGGFSGYSYPPVHRDFAGYNPNQGK